jgi:hypothetical protein
MSERSRGTRHLSAKASVSRGRFFLIALICMTGPGCLLLFPPEPPTPDAGPDESLFDDVTAGLPAPSRTSHTMEARAADFDRDGDLDLLLAKEFQPTALLLNDGAGQFSDGSDRLPPREARDHEDIAVADLDLDGDLDAVVSCEDDSVKELYLNDGTGHFTDASDRLPQQGQSNAVLAADVDKDGDADLLFGNAGPDFLLRNDGTGHFEDLSATHLPQHDDVTQDIAAADLDADGDLDLVIANEDGNRLYLNDGAGRFSEAATGALPLRSSHEESRNADLGDVDGDGDVDLFFSNVGFRSTSNPQDRLLINRGNAQFSDMTATQYPQEQRNTLDGDFIDVDRDGDLDIVQATFGESNRYRVFTNDGAGTFVDSTQAIFPETAIGMGVEVEPGDYNGDGKVDLYLTGFMGPDRLLLAK